ncbi:MAG: hypothetical protein ABI619_01045 [Betaproteobacteria bacterium]
MVMSITLRLPAKLKMRAARAARQKGQSTTRWLLAAVEHEVERRERFFAYVKHAHASPDAGPVEDGCAQARPVLAGPTFRR